MKKLIFILLAALPVIAVAQQNYTIKLNVKHVNPKAKAYLFYMTNQKVNRDSAILVGKQFVFKGRQAEPMKAYILLSPHGTPVDSIADSDKIAIYLENGTITVNATDSLLHATVGGTRLNNDQQQMVTMLEPYATKTKEMIADYDQPGTSDSEKEKIKADYVVLENRKKEAVASFIKNHPNSLVSVNLLLTAVDPGKDMTSARTLFNSLTAAVQNSANGKIYKVALTGAATVELGSMAPAFTLKNTKEEDISLASFKGKYVLVDFWASWCGPCRQENPNVVRTFQKYKDKNFTVLGVSLDGGPQGKQRWIDAIKKDGLVWEQVSDLKGWQSNVAKLYKVTAIPANFLIDPTGKIIARDLDGTELDEKLKSLIL